MSLIEQCLDAFVVALAIIFLVVAVALLTT